MMRTDWPTTTLIEKWLVDKLVDIKIIANSKKFKKRESKIMKITCTESPLSSKTFL